MNDELIPINVWLAGRSYRILIKPDEESVVRRAVKVADDKIGDLRNEYAGKDMQDFMAMCLLAYAADTAIDAFNNPLLLERVDELSSRIDKVLGREDKV